LNVTLVKVKQGIVMENGEKRDELLIKAKKLVAYIEEGNEQAAEETLNSMTITREQNLFNEVGQLTRQLHDNLASFASEGQLTELTDKEIPDAKERLNYVLKLTDEAATTTLNAIDDILPVTDKMQKTSEALSKKWRKFVGRELSLTEFRAMSGEITEFLDASCENSDFVHKKSNEIVMAQGFQDLTGQIITKVIVLVQEVEESLVNLVRIAGSQKNEAEDIVIHKKEALEGPLVPGIEVEGAVNNQDDVDDLLSSLGF